MSYVYVFDFGDMVKVGISTHPLTRLRELEKGNNTRATRTFAIQADDHAGLIEKKIHEKLANSLIQGREYFSCSFRMAREISVSIATEVLGRHISGVVVGSVVSDAQKEATARYNKKAYDRIEIKVKKGRKAGIFAYAAQRGKSVNQLIVELIDREMGKEDAN